MTAVYLETALDLAQDAILGEGTLRLRVDGDSMAPLIRPGDVLLVQAVSPQSLRLGDLVVVRRARDLVAHRLVRMEAGGWRTKGDHQPFIDPASSENAILGRVTEIEHPGGRAEKLDGQWEVANRRLARMSAWEGALFSALSGRGQGAGGQAAGSRLRSAARRLVGLPFRMAVWWIVFWERSRA